MLPQVMLSDTRTKSNLVVGQVFFEGSNGDLATGPNLKSFGLVSREVHLGPISVSQPDITLGELLNAIGASDSSCGASLPTQKARREGLGWFEHEKDVLVGTEVSLLLEDAAEELVDPNSLQRLYREASSRSVKDPWAPADNSAHPSTFAVVKTLYAREITIRFRVPEKVSIPLTSEYFLGYTANSVNEVILTLIRMASACGVQGHARGLPDPGLEAVISRPAPTTEGIELASLENGRVIAKTPIETDLLIYESPRLPRYSHEDRVPGNEPVWKVDTDGVLSSLSHTNGHLRLDDGSTFFKYCSGGHCDDAIITGPHEFDPEDGSSYNHDLGCSVGPPSAWWNFFGQVKGVFQRKVELRELVLFFGPPPADDSGLGYNDYTSEIVHKAQPGNMTPSPKAGPTKAVWIYEYHCEGGIAQLRPDPHGTHLDVPQHLKGMGLDH